MTALIPSPTQSPNQQDVDDASLVRAHVDGREDAFDELYRRYFPRVVQLLTGRLGDTEIAQDLAQETFIRAMHGLHRFDPDRPLWPWLRRIATNAGIDWVRTRGRQDALARALAGQPDTAVVLPDVGEQQLLRDALAAVPERQRDALERCYIQGWRPVDAAEEFGVGSNAFEQLLHRARRNLRRAYVGANDGDRAAGLGWLLPLLWIGRAVASPVARARRLASQVPTLAQAAGATVAIVATVALLPTAQPPESRAAAPSQAAVVDVTPAAATSAVNGQALAEPSSGSADTSAPGRALELSSGSNRPAPVAVSPDAAAPTAPGVPIPAPAPTLDPGIGSANASLPGVAEVLQGCGSAVRQVACDATDLQSP